MVKVRNKEIMENTNTKAIGIMVRKRGKVARKTLLRKNNTPDNFIRIKDKDPGN